MAITVFSILPDYNFATIRPGDGRTLGGIGQFSGESMRDTWSPLVFYVKDPVRTVVGDFFNAFPGVLAFRECVLASELGVILESCGEILPARLESPNEAIYLLNVLAIYNCLDRSKAAMRMTPDGKRAIHVDRYSFHEGRIGDVGVFKIPEQVTTDVFTVLRYSTTNDDFVSKYHQLNFRGLHFNEVWSDDRFGPA